MSSLPVPELAEAEGAAPAVHEFRPDWTLAPAATLREWMRENEMTVRVLTWVSCDRSGDERASHERARTLIQDALDRRPLTEEHAKVLARGTGVSAAFWNALEHNYRAGLAAGLTDITPEDDHG
jgi:hypothetical protein